jgi:hypothetical protein
LKVLDSFDFPVAGSVTGRNEGAAVQAAGSECTTGAGLIKSNEHQVALETVDTARFLAMQGIT